MDEFIDNEMTSNRCVLFCAVDWLQIIVSKTIFVTRLPDYNA